MDHWIFQNLIILILACFSGWDLLKRFSSSLRAAFLRLPLKCYLKAAAQLARGKEAASLYYQDSLEQKYPDRHHDSYHEL